MLAPLALLLCLLFVGYLLRNEQKQANTVSRAAWIPTLWVLYFASKPIGRWLKPQGAIEDSPEDGLFVVGLIVLGLIIIGKRKLDWKIWLREGRLLVWLLGYMLVSCLWSDEPFGSIKQWARAFGSVVMALAILTEPDPNRTLQSIFARTVYVLVPLSVMLVKYFPNQGVEYRRWNGETFWVGATLAKNGLGRLCLVCSVFLVWALIKRWKGRESRTWKHQTYVEVLLLLLIGWLLRGPGGNRPMTAIATIILCSAALLGLLVLNRQLANRLFSHLTRITLVLAAALAFISISGQIPTFGVKSMGRDMTFTGRTDIWNGVRSAAWENPIQGVGYGAYWSKYHEFPNVGSVNEGHNGYLDTFVETGLIGLALLLFVIVSYVRRVIRGKRDDDDWASFRIVFLLMLVMHNFTETSFLRCSEHFWALFILMYVVFPENTRQIVAGKAGEAVVGAAEFQKETICSA